MNNKKKVVISVFIFLSVLLWIVTYYKWYALPSYMVQPSFFAIPVIIQLVLLCILFYFFRSLSTETSSSIDVQSATLNNKSSSFLTIIVWVLPLVGSLYAFFYYCSMNPESAPQQASVAAMSLVYCVIPYVFARAIQEIRNNKQ